MCVSPPSRRHFVGISKRERGGNVQACSAYYAPSPSSKAKAKAWEKKQHRSRFHLTVTYTGSLTLHNNNNHYLLRMATGIVEMCVRPPGVGVASVWSNGVTASEARRPIAWLYRGVT